MDKSLRVKKSYRNLGSALLIFYSCVMLASVFIAWSHRSILGSAILAAFWGFFVVLSAMLLLSYYRESLYVSDVKVVQTGILRTREMAFGDVIRVRWRVVPVGGSVILHSSTNKVTISFDTFEFEQRRWLIRMVRQSLSPSIQWDWERFCLRIALPLLKHGIDTPLQPGEYLVTRRRWDRFFVVTTVVLVVLGLICAWLLRSPPLLAFPLVSLVLWPLMRFFTPRKGIRYSRTPPLEKKHVLFSLIWCVVAIGTLPPLSRNYPGMAIGLLIPWCAVLLHQAYRVGRRQEAVRDAAAPAAAEEWERLTGTGSGVTFEIDEADGRPRQSRPPNEE